MLEIRDLHYSYGAIQALKGISFDVKKGEIFSLVGSNGAGKSTLLSNIAGVLKSQQGELLLNGQSMAGKGVRHMVNSGVILVPEGRQIFGDLKVKENLLLGAYRHGKKVNLEKELEQVYELFPKLKLLQDRTAGTLSGGEQQMVAIGRGLMAKPEILLLDEPSLGLAPLVIKEIFLQLENLKQTGVTVILVEQNAKAALKISDRAAVLVRGVIEVIEDAHVLLNSKKLTEMYVGSTG